MRKGRVFLIVALFAMTVTLSGCDFFGLFGSGPSNTTPTAVATSGSNTGTGIGGLTTYDGGTYTIGYQSDWKVEKKDNGVVTFTSPLGPITLVVVKVPNPGGILPADASSASSVAAASLGVEDAVQQGAPTNTTIGGQSWNEVTQIGTVKTDDGQSVQAKSTLLAANYPAASPSTNLYVLAYTGTIDTYDLLKSTYFQPMLDSFKFTA